MKKIKNNKKQEPLTKISETDSGARRANIITGLIVAFFVGVSFYVRAIIPYERMSQVMAEGLTFAMDDAVFHMRLVENTIANFPNRIFYDAFTQFPYGNRLHWGALFDQTIAAISIIAGRIFDGGAPSQLTINTVGSFYPAVLGALCVIPAFYIAKELAGRKAGIIAAALTALLPGQFLSRSVLGFTDNHIAEVLFLTIAVMYFVMALKKSESLTFDNFRESKVHLVIPGFINAIMAGFFLGIYLLNWTAGVFFIVVFGIFIGLQFVIDNLKSKPTDYLIIISIPLFIIPALLVSPYVEIGNGFDSAYYSLLHIVVPLIGLAMTALLYTILKKMKPSPIAFIIILAVIMGVGGLVIKLILPDLFATTLGNMAIMFSARTGGQATVAEAQTMNTATAVGYFGINYYLSFIGLAIIGYISIRRQKPEYTLVAVWSIFILLISLAELRFSYYYAINVAVMTSVWAAFILDWVGWKEFNLNSIKNTISSLKAYPIIILLILIVGMIFYPQDSSIFKISTTATKSGALTAGYFEWYDAMKWMRNNTPDTGVDYYGTYTRPAQGEKYPYPSTAYGVMSWWDYGHDITYWGHRIPNANPFQAGIGGGDTHSPGASTFLTAQTEQEANKILDELGTRYIVTDGFMAYGIQNIIATWNKQTDIMDAGFSGTTEFQPNKFYITGIRTNNGYQQAPGLKSFTSMTGKLHILDTDGLQRYRLVHETFPSPATLNAKVGGGNPQLEEQSKALYNLMFGHNTASQAIAPQATGYVKIFEYVKGGNIFGTAPANTTVSISLPIKTNQGREFKYTQTTMSDRHGLFSLVVPYSTTGWETRTTNFDTKPTGKYVISVNGKSKEFDMTESQIVLGRSISIGMT
ncbi:MAG: oligosaccharyl transferase, archaeosortase A system-associated [Candidatus Ratteibacteria bacterium]|nr:oligosaccharyl transferase, archaeosortase A system-associated [Candidatus Ratteibacteria bacterium]